MKLESFTGLKLPNISVTIPSFFAKFSYDQCYTVVIIFLQWHQLDRAEQAKYYDQARRERALHMQLYPGWSARENYAQQGKKKKRKRDKSQGDNSGEC
jgi:hypothetical protein